MILILVGTTILCYNNYSTILPLLLQGRAINYFTLFTLASIMWSIDPMLSAKRSVLMITCIAFAYYMVACYDMEEIIRRLAITCLSVLAISAIVSIALPSIGRSTLSHPGSWNGVFSHKNSLGWITILGNVTYGWLFVTEPKRRIRHGLVILFFLFIAVMSQSKTGLIGSLGSIFLYPILSSLRLPGMLRLWIVFIIVSGAVFGLCILVVFWTDILTGIGRDPTLTGRIPLWGLLLELWLRHSIEGYGYAAFWTMWNPDAQYIWNVILWTAPEAHNAYIDMLLQLGLVGFFISIWIMAYSIIRSLHHFLAGQYVWSSFILVYSISLSITNMSETMLFRAGDIHCWLVPVCYIALIKAKMSVVNPLTNSLALNSVRPSCLMNKKPAAIQRPS